MQELDTYDVAVSSNPAFLFITHLKDGITTMDSRHCKQDPEPRELSEIRQEIDLIDEQLLGIIVTRCHLAVSTLDVKVR